MPVPDLTDPQPLYQQFAGDLRARIASGEYKPGDRLPTQAAMAGEYGTTATTIAKALGVLRAEGLVGTRGRTGSFVLAAGSGGPPGWARAAAVEAEISQVRERVGRLEAEMAGLYHATGVPYPRETGQRQDGQAAGPAGRADVR